MKKKRNMDDRRNKGKQKEQRLEEDFQDVDEETLQFQQVLYNSARFSSSLKFELEWDFQDDTADVKKKGIDKACSMEDISGLSSWSSQYEKGEPSCTFCVICNDAKPTGAMKRNDTCGHYFCEDCIKEYFGEQIQEDVMEVKCPETNCKRILDIALCKSLVPDKDFLHYWHISFSEIKALTWPRILECPNPLCRGEFFDDRRNFRIIACPNCWGLICVECWVPYHMGLSCRQYQHWLRVRQLFSSEQPIVLVFLPSEQNSEDICLVTRIEDMKDKLNCIGRK